MDSIYPNIFQYMTNLKKGRPKNKIQLTDEEKVLRMRQIVSENYYQNIEKDDYNNPKNIND